jgi:hypothetical protein
MSSVKFANVPSIGSSCGLLLVVWNGAMFKGEVTQENNYAITVKFLALSSLLEFHVTNIYGPYTPVEKVAFMNWFYNFDSSNIEDWVLLGYFNLIRSPNNRNKPGESTSDMLLFSDFIHIPFEGKQFTCLTYKMTHYLKNLTEFLSLLLGPFLIYQPV